MLNLTNSKIATNHGIDQSVFLTIEAHSNSCWIRTAGLQSVHVLAKLDGLTPLQVSIVLRHVSLAAKSDGPHKVYCVAESDVAHYKEIHTRWLAEASSLKSLVAKENSLGESSPWFWKLAEIALLMGSQFQNENRKSTFKKRGRRVIGDQHETNKISEAWNTRQYRRYEDLAIARGKGETASDIRKSVERHRKASRRKSCDKDI